MTDEEKLLDCKCLYSLILRHQPYICHLIKMNSELTCVENHLGYTRIDKETEKELLEIRCRWDREIGFRLRMIFYQNLDIFDTHEMMMWLEGDFDEND